MPLTNARTPPTLSPAEKACAAGCHAPVMNASRSGFPPGTWLSHGRIGGSARTSDRAAPGCRTAHSNEVSAPYDEPTRSAGQLQGSQQPSQIGSMKRSGKLGATARPRVRIMIAAAVGYHMEMLRKESDLNVPRAIVADAAVYENQWRALALLRVGEAGAVNVNFRHTLVSITVARWFTYCRPVELLERFSSAKTQKQERANDMISPPAWRTVSALTGRDIT